MWVGSETFDVMHSTCTPVRSGPQILMQLHVLTGISIETEKGIEGALEGIDLGREVDDRWHRLEEYDGVSKKLALDPIGDEVTWRLMIAHDTGLAKSKAASCEPSRAVGKSE